MLSCTSFLRRERIFERIGEYNPTSLDWLVGMTSLPRAFLGVTGAEWGSLRDERRRLLLNGSDERSPVPNEDTGALEELGGDICRGV